LISPVRHKARAHQFGYAEMLRDVLVASINRGQFLIAIVGIVVMIAVMKMPQADVSKLIFRLVESMENGKLLGYLLAVVLALSWFYHARWQRRLIAEEMQRIGQLRTELQSKVLGKRLKSSEGRL
jgi:hypothetical protein